MRYALLRLIILTNHDDQRGIVEKYGDDVLRAVLSTVPPGSTFTLAEVCDNNALSHLQPKTRRRYTQLILENTIAAFPHDSGPVARLGRQGKTNCYTWLRVPHPHVSKKQYTVSADAFKARTGRTPQPWELDLANCPQAGTVGHYGCGWCSFHNQPILICNCRER